MASPSFKITIYDYLRILFQRKWYIIACIFTSLFIATWIAYSKPSLYVQKSAMRIRDVMKENPFIPPIVRVGKPHRFERIKYANFMNEKGCMSFVKEYNLVEGKVTEAKIRRTARKIMHCLSIRKRGDFIYFKVVDTDPDFILKVLKAAMDKMSKEYNNIVLSDIKIAKSILSQEMKKYKEKLKDRLYKLEKFDKAKKLEIDKKNRFLTYEETRKNYELLRNLVNPVTASMQTLLTLHNELLDTQMEIEELENESVAIKRQLQGEKDQIVTMIRKKDNAIIKSLKEERTKAKYELEKLLVDASEQHPKVKELREKIARLDTLITESEQSSVIEKTLGPNPVKKELDNRLREIQARLIALKKKEEKLILMIEECEKNLERKPDEAIQREKLTKEINIYKKLYRNLERSYNDALRVENYIKSNLSPIFEISIPPVKPKMPIAPNRKMIILLGLFVGVMSAITVVFFVEFADHSIKGVEDLQRYFNIPVLGVIPEFTLISEEQRERSKKKWLKWRKKKEKEIIEE